LFAKRSDEGGADQIYDGASKSAFDDALNGKHAGSMYQSGHERFKVESMAPEVDVHTPGMAEAAGTHGKPTATWAQAKPRFEDAKLSTTAEYETYQSDFSKQHRGPSPNMVVSDREKGRNSWISRGVEIVDTPPPGNPSSGAFDASLKKTSPSPFAQAGGDRFKNLYTVSSFGEPSSTTSGVSDFDKAARNTKPSPSSVSNVDRFRAVYDIPSYGDPGAGSSSVDLERHQLEQKVSRQRHQAEAQRDRVMHDEYQQ